MTIPIKIISKKEFEKIKQKPNQEIVWNNIAKPWKNYVVKKIPVVENFLNKISLKWKGDEECRIVDLGCGTGRNMIFKENIEYCGVDFSKGQLIYAEKYMKLNKINGTLKKGSVDKLDKDFFKDNMFDYGLFIASLHCLESSEKRLNALKEFYRVLKKNAEALISVWNSEDKRFDCVNNHGDIYMSWKEDGIDYMRYYYLYSRNEFLDLLKSVGFKIIEVYKPILHDRFSKKNLIIRIKK